MLSNTSSLFPELGGFEGTVKQVLAMTDIILDQVLRSLGGKTLSRIWCITGDVMSVFPMKIE